MRYISLSKAQENLVTVRTVFEECLFPVWNIRTYYVEAIFCSENS